MRRTALIVGTPGSCVTLERQLSLLDDPPLVMGRVTPEGTGDPSELGPIDRLEQIVAERRPDLALVTLPAVMTDLVTSVRTRLRRVGVPDRFVPTLEDLVAGVGPRTHWDVDLDALLDRPPRSIDDGAIGRLIAGRRVLITGAGGSIGSELSRLVAGHAPAHVALVERSENALFEIDRRVARWFPELSRTALLHDVVEAKPTLAHFRRLRPQVILHAAAHKHVPMMEDHPAAAVDNNLFGTKSVADAAAAVGADRLVMISTDKAVNPSSIMGATKRLAELYVQSVNRRHDVGCSMVRFGNVLGSSGSVIEVWTRQLAEGGPITVTHPEMTRYFMTVPEAASLVLQSAALMESDLDGGEVFLLDMGAPVRIADLARRFVELHGLVPVTTDAAAAAAGPAAVRVVFTGARPGEKLHEDLSFDAESMRPTPHDDINIWMLPPPADRYIEDMVRSLDPVRRPHDPVALARLIRRLVPEMVQPVAA